jgi:hypothetical protein
MEILTSPAEQRGPLTRQWPSTGSVIALTEPAVWGRYSTRDEARRARKRFKDAPGAQYRVRYMPSERWPAEPWTVLAFAWEHEADAINEHGEVNSAVRNVSA